MLFFTSHVARPQTLGYKYEPSSDLRRAVAQEPGLRRVQARTTRPLKLDPGRPEYHRATLHWHPVGCGGDSSSGAPNCQRRPPVVYIISLEVNGDGFLLQLPQKL